MTKKKISSKNLLQALELFGISVDNLKLISEKESGNTVYEHVNGDSKSVLKLIYHSGKGKQEVLNVLLGEIEWINYLSDNGIKTPRAVKSNRGNFVEFVDIDTNTYVSIVSYEKVHGRPIATKDYSPELFTKMGILTAKMHALAKSYKPAQNIKRPEWYEDEYLNIRKLIPETDNELKSHANNLIEDLKKVSSDNESYGLIHSDLQEHNLRLCKNELAVLDFESSIYCWFICDFVSSLEGIIGGMEVGTEANHLTRSFSSNYWQGYNKYNSLPKFYYQKIPDFFRLWEILLYCQFINEWDLDSLSTKRKLILKNYRLDIIRGIRFRDIDFKQFCENDI